MSPRLLVLLLCVVNLVAGTAIGIVLDRTVLREHRGPGRGRPDPARMQEARIQEMEKRLELDADQAKKVREIYSARRAAFEAAMRETRPRMDALRAESDAQIRALLRPEQQPRFDELCREWLEKFEKHKDRDRHGGSASVGSDSATQQPAQKEGVR